MSESSHGVHRVSEGIWGYIRRVDLVAKQHKPIALQDFRDTPNGRRWLASLYLEGLESGVIGSANACLVINHRLMLTGGNTE